MFKRNYLNQPKAILLYLAYEELEFDILTGERPISIYIKLHFFIIIKRITNKHEI